MFHYIDHSCIPFDPILLNENEKKAFYIIFPNWNNMQTFTKPTTIEVTTSLKNNNLKNINEKTKKIIEMEILPTEKNIYENGVLDYIKILLTLKFDNFDYKDMPGLSKELQQKFIYVF